MNLSSYPILTTKLKPPHATRNLVVRTRLYEILERGFASKLTLVAAPAGYGKTTLVSEWVLGKDLPTAWFTVDERDNDPARFLIHLIAALQTVNQNIGADALEVLYSPVQMRIEAILSLLINDLATSGSPLILVLDDYHLLEHTKLHEAMAFFLAHMPSSMHLVIASRVDPPLRLGKLRASGQLEEIREADLRFSADEASAMLVRTMGIRLGGDSVEVLTSRTEGWIAGLQLAALSMKKREDTKSFLEAFSGTHRYIVDYLTDEVLEQQPEQIRNFLLETSILDRLNGPLCAALTEQEAAQTILERLEEDHLFLVSLDDERHWYRYHALFADMLRKRLAQERGEEVTELHTRAARWFERSGELDVAVEHALQAEKYDHAILLVERIAQDTLIRTEFVTFLRWAEALPEEVMHTRPRLCVYYASALVLSGRNLDLARSLLERAVQDDPSDRLRGQATLFQAVIASLRGDVQTAIAKSEEALRLLSDDHGYMRSLVIGHLGVGYLASGDVEAARAMFADAADKGERAGSYLSSVMAIRRLAEISIIQGELHAAWSHCERGLRLATGRQGNLLPVAGLIKTVQGELLRQWNDLQASCEHLEDGLELLLRWSELLAIDDYITLARVKQAQNDTEGAMEAMSRAEQIARQSDASRVAPIIVSLHQPRLWVAQGKMDAVRRWTDAHMPLTRILSAEGYDVRFYHHLIEIEDITLARVYLALGELDRSLAILDPLYDAAERLGRAGTLTEIRVLQALSHHGRGEGELAWSTLAEALQRAEAQGYVRLFVDEGQPMLHLLTTMLERTERRDMSGNTVFPTPYARKLLSSIQIELEMRETALIPDSIGLIEPLSERELQVLRLLASHLTSTEIADALFISVNTVRFHIKNIYAKLGVHRRADAIKSAKESGIL